jgi:FMN-dependent NADH-azoreductase
MQKLLYVTCDLRPVEHSRSLIVGSEFLNEYIRWNPEDEIHMLDLYRDYIQRTDADVLIGLEKMRKGHHFAALTTDEQRKIGRIWKLIDQFVAVDKYVFVAPIGNMGIPDELRMYVDTVCVVNKAYRDADRGPKAILKYQKKKCLLIHSIYRLDSRDKEVHSLSYFRSVMKLIDIEKFEAIAVKGNDAIPEKVREGIDEEIKEALKSAVQF